MGLSFASQASAQVAIRPVPAPDDILRICLHHIKFIAKHCVDANQAVAARCVPAIRSLLAQGRVRAAFRLARHCKRIIRAQTRECIEKIRAICDHCARALAHISLSDQRHDRRLRSLKAACWDAIRAIRASRDVACKAIIDALPVQDGTDVAG
jgi:hypothetical protein